MSNEFVKTIWVTKKEAFESKVKHLNRILAKHGKPAITFKYTNYRLKEVEFTYHLKGDAFKNDEVTKVKVEVCDAVCTGYTEVKRDDVPFVYLGTVSKIEGVTQIFCKDDAFLPYFTDKFRENFCDHCRTTRANRKSYHLFHNTATGEVVQIGSTCAKEYFGIDSVAFLDTYGKTFYCDYTGWEDMEGGFSGNDSFGATFAEVAPVVSMTTNGFLKWTKRSEFEDSSASACHEAINSWFNGCLEPIRPSDADRKNAALLTYDEVLAFWTAKYEKEQTSFAFNCKEAIKAGYTTRRSIGSFAYAIFAAFNAKVKAIRDAEIAAHTTIVPCAYAVGTRANLTGVVTNIRTFETENPFSYYGGDITKYIVDFTDQNGTFYHFTTSATSFADINKGDRINMRCTIGESKPFKGIPYTRVSRPVCTVQKEDGESAVA